MRYHLIQLVQLLIALGITLLAFAAGVGVGWLRWGGGRSTVRTRLRGWLASDEEAERTSASAQRRPVYVAPMGGAPLFAPDLVADLSDGPPTEAMASVDHLGVARAAISPAPAGFDPVERGS